MGKSGLLAVGEGGSFFCVVLSHVVSVVKERGLTARSVPVGCRVAHMFLGCQGNKRLWLCVSSSSRRKKAVAFIACGVAASGGRGKEIILRAARGRNCYFLVRWAVRLIRPIHASTIGTRFKPTDSLKVIT